MKRLHTRKTTPELIDRMDSIEERLANLADRPFSEAWTRWERLNGIHAWIRLVLMGRNDFHHQLRDAA